MTDDLVQRLRSHADDWLDGTEGRAMLSGAADALERLQADNQVLSDEVAAHDKELWQGAYTDAVNKKLRAEVVRLQQALRDVLDVLYDPPPDDDNDRWFTVLAAARAVLDEGNQQ